MNKMMKNEMMVAKELTREVLRNMLEEDFGVMLSNNSFKKMKREALIDEYISSREAEETIVPVGDFSSDKYVTEDVPFIQVTSYHKLEISKKVKDACLNNGLSYAGISTQDLQDIVAEVLFGQKLWRFHSVQTGVSGVVGSTVIYNYRKERVRNEEIAATQEDVITETIQKMVDQDCLSLNKKGTFFFLSSKLRNWQF